METNRVNVRNCKLLLRIPLLLKCIDTLENGNFSEYAVSRRGLGDGEFQKIPLSIHEQHKLPILNLLKMQQPLHAIIYYVQRGFLLIFDCFY